jgi:hypothetical protein
MQDRPAPDLLGHKALNLAGGALAVSEGVETQGKHGSRAITHQACRMLWQPRGAMDGLLSRMPRHARHG